MAQTATKSLFQDGIKLQEFEWNEIFCKLPLGPHLRMWQQNHKKSHCPAQTGVRRLQSVQDLSPAYVSRTPS